ncbi:hypothetical protein BB558_002456 [Smittium angustum]|uniref:Phosphatidylinositol 3-kinase VPS34 n=1 Tax=Smittium angustum TaxID=133377 RepID=A0A2U1J900_SMIAN|nr:hypothetical protein BB558_002456 [Smittium angustum]
MDYTEQTTNFHDFSYYTSKDLAINVSIKILELEGRLAPENGIILHRELEPYAEWEQESEFYVTAQLWTDGQPMCLPMQTAYKPLHNKKEWNETLEMPVKYCDLSYNTIFALTVWRYGNDKKMSIVGGNQARIFSRNNKLKEGKQRINLIPGKAADTAPDRDFTAKREKNSLDILEKNLKKYENNEMKKLDWLDKLVFEKIEKSRNKMKEELDGIFLTFELNKFDFPLVWSETERIDSERLYIGDERFYFVFDPELFRKNVVESKYRKLVRGNFYGHLDKDLKPNLKTRDQLLTIINYTPSKAMTDLEKDLIWKYRYFLKNNHMAIGKFVQSVDWKDEREAPEAKRLLIMWENVGIEEALELLCPHINQNSKTVWSYSISILNNTSNSIILMYLLQLVQAIRFEPGSRKEIKTNIETNSSSISRRLSLEEIQTNINPLGVSANKDVDYDLGQLAQFLVNRSLDNTELCTRLYWHLMVECESNEYGKLYGRVAYHLMSTMVLSNKGRLERELLRRQSELVLKLSKVSREISKSKEFRTKKVEFLQNYLNDPKNELLNFKPIPFPTNPKIIVTGMVPEKANVFKSAMSPLLLVFNTIEGKEYTIIYKCGDDMRQDQLVLQIIKVMDTLLQKESLDLKLTCYGVLATGVDQGMTEFVPSMSLASILAENSNKITNYFQKTYSKSSGSSNYLSEGTIMDNYIKSCAGYCVITYLLGVGDRHLDNLLLTESGKLFHVDYGFILGNDPKPFPPPIKLCKEMVEAMSPSLQTGGSGSLGSNGDLGLEEQQQLKNGKFKVDHQSILFGE